MDVTTDKAGVEQEILFLRTARHGKIITKFLCVGELLADSDSDPNFEFKQVFRIASKHIYRISNTGLVKKNSWKNAFTFLFL